MGRPGHAECRTAAPQWVTALQRSAVERSVRANDVMAFIFAEWIIIAEWMIIVEGIIISADDRAVTLMSAESGKMKVRMVSVEPYLRHYCGMFYLFNYAE